jgi:hypothetical protein
MCQYACAPAPNTTTVWTRLRLEKRKVLANAVRNAVSVVAARKACGWPDGLKRVSVPEGRVSGLEVSVLVFDTIELAELDGSLESVLTVTTLMPMLVVVRAGCRLSVFNICIDLNPNPA